MSDSPIADTALSAYKEYEVPHTISALLRMKEKESNALRSHLVEAKRTIGAMESWLIHLHERFLLARITDKEIAENSKAALREHEALLLEEMAGNFPASPNGYFYGDILRKEAAARRNQK